MVARLGNEAGDAVGDREVADEGGDQGADQGDIEVDVAAGGEVDTGGDRGGLLLWPSVAPGRGA